MLLYLIIISHYYINISIHICVDTFYEYYYEYNYVMNIFHYVQFYGNIIETREE